MPQPRPWAPSKTSLDLRRPDERGGVDALQDIAKTSVKKAYVIGREAAEFARQIGVDAEVCTTMRAAVQAAARDAETGDTVLLAPAAASLDQYDNF